MEEVGVAFIEAENNYGGVFTIRNINQKPRNYGVCDSCVYHNELLPLLPPYSLLSLGLFSHVVYKMQCKTTHTGNLGPGGEGGIEQ